MNQIAITEPITGQINQMWFDADGTCHAMMMIRVPEDAWAALPPTERKYYGYRTIHLTLTEAAFQRIWQAKYPTAQTTFTLAPEDIVFGESPVLARQTAADDGYPNQLTRVTIGAAAAEDE